MRMTLFVTCNLAKSTMQMTVWLPARYGFNIQRILTKKTTPAGENSHIQQELSFKVIAKQSIKVLKSNRK